MIAAPKDARIDDPYCRACGYNLAGLRESSKCPECGGAFVDVLVRKGLNPAQMGTRRYKSPITLFGLPLIAVAFGPGEEGARGKAKGFIALGDQAIGVLAIGGMAIGGVALGGFSIGIFGIGGCAIGLFAFGGWAMGGMTMGGGALALLAMGGGAIGFIAIGGGAVGYYASGGGAFGKYIMNARYKSPEAEALMSNLDWLLGAGGRFGLLVPLGWMLLVLVVLLTVIGILAVQAYIKHDKKTSPSGS